MDETDNQKLYDDIFAKNLRTLEAVFNGLLDGGARCLTCGVEITKVRQVKRCVYAEPCGHRQYQGKIVKS